jgi:hypothetical protein
MPEHSHRAIKKKKPAPFTLSHRQTEIVKNWESAFGLAPKETAVIENCGLSLVYERLASGEYEAYKDGNRTKDHRRVHQTSPCQPATG